MGSEAHRSWLASENRFYLSPSGDTQLSFKKSCEELRPPHLTFPLACPIVERCPEGGPGKCEGLRCALTAT